MVGYADTSRRSMRSLSAACAGAAPRAVSAKRAAIAVAVRVLRMRMWSAHRLELEVGPAEADRISVDELLARDSLVIDVGAVGRAEILHAVGAARDRELGVAAADRR